MNSIPNLPSRGDIQAQVTTVFGVVRSLLVAGGVLAFMFSGQAAHAATPQAEIPHKFLKYEHKDARKRVEVGDTIWRVGNSSRTTR
ncbi:hypothetical protein [Spongiactinospora sp. TRM90649]|uniref:hypothetical protein n=1 Tax=Spongiactinospora sp. TRM90649 TaxID=3031114 RepID=UPI0023F8D852|nr:hypothetical protein [Spongiactinospora sp. TRM90649]MDF5754726.1 hypothetical protein [Spongiactinospora sp. TRM90649]